MSSRKDCRRTYFLDFFPEKQVQGNLITILNFHSTIPACFVPAAFGSRTKHNSGDKFGLFRYKPYLREDQIYHKCSEIQVSALLILSPKALVSLLTAFAVSHPWAIIEINKIIINNILLLNDMRSLRQKLFIKNLR